MFILSFQLYQEAMELCIQAYGHLHYLTGRINFNLAICYEDARQYSKSYELFLKNYNINRDVYGEDHIKTVRSKNVLEEPTYARVKQMRNNQQAGDQDDSLRNTGLL